MLSAMDLIARPDADDFVLRLLGAEVECLYAVVINDPSKLHTALTNGLEEHRKYWTHDDRANKPEGLLALGLSFVARMAAQAGMRIEVRSPYLVYANK